MRPTSTFASFLFTAAALATTHARAADGSVDRGFGEVPGYTAFGVSGLNYIDVGASASTRFDRTWVFIEGYPHQTQLHLARLYSSSGLLDTGFGPNNDGFRSVDLPAGLAGPAVNGAIALDDGTTVAFGRLRELIGNDYAGFVCRFAVAGNLHPGFGTNGCTTLRSFVPDSESLSVTAVAEDNIGRLVVAGTYEDRNDLPPHVEHRFVARLGTNGLLDPEFAGGVGFITLPHHVGDGQYQNVAAARVDDQGRILLLSTVTVDYQDSDYDILLQRFDDGGTPDPEFATAGTRQISFIVNGDKQDLARDMHLLPDGRIVVLGFRSWLDYSIVLMRFNADATQYDATFNGGAARIEPLVADAMIPYIGPLAIDDLGRSYAVIDGGTIGQRRTLVMRHRADGTPDPTFGVAGRSEVTGQALTGDPTLNTFKIVGATIVGRDRLLMTASIGDEDFNDKRALLYSLAAGTLFRDGFD